MGGGGAERVLVTLLNALDPGKFDITLLLLYKEGPFLASVPSYVKVIGLFKSYASQTVRALTHFAAVRDPLRAMLARRKLGAGRFDVTVSFMEGAAAKLHSQLMDFAPRNLSWVHCNMRLGRWYDFWFKKEAEKPFYAALDKVAFVSKELRDEFSGIFATDAEKVVIYNPVDVAFLERQAAEEQPVRDEDVFTIVNSGRLVAQKDHLLLIQVASILRDHGRKFRVDILGDGPLRSRLEEAVKKAGLEGLVVFHGFRRNPFPMIKRADVFCMTSVWEGCPMVVAESLSLGTPVVSTPIKAVGEMIAQGGGVLTDGSADGIAAALETLMDNPRKLREMRELAVRNAAMFDLPTIAGQVSDFIVKP